MSSAVVKKLLACFHFAHASDLNVAQLAQPGSQSAFWSPLPCLLFPPAPRPKRGVCTHCGLTHRSLTPAILHSHRCCVAKPQSCFIFIVHFICTLSNNAQESEVICLWWHRPHLFSFKALTHQALLLTTWQQVLNSRSGQPVGTRKTEHVRGSGWREVRLHSSKTGWAPHVCRLNRGQVVFYACSSLLSTFRILFFTELVWSSISVWMVLVNQTSSWPFSGREI